MPRFFCAIYNKRPEWCVGYPWNSANDLFPDCIFVDKDKKLMSLEEMLKTHDMEEIQELCQACGHCCRLWEGGKPVVNCSALKIEGL